MQITADQMMAYGSVRVLFGGCPTVERGALAAILREFRGTTQRARRAGDGAMAIYYAGAIARVRDALRVERAAARYYAARIASEG